MTPGLLDGVANVGEHLTYGIVSLRTLAEYILAAGLDVHPDAADTGSLLSAVMLLFHQEIEFVESVEFRPILLFIIGQRLQKANHCDSAFMLYQFHFDFLKMKMQN